MLALLNLNNEEKNMAVKVKLKTHKGASKRFKPKKNGQIKHMQSHKRHILTKKSSKRIRQLRKLKDVAESDKASIEQMLKIN